MFIFFLFYFYIFFFSFFIFFFFFFFFFNDTATTEIYTLSLHDALPTSTPIPTSVPAVPAALAASREPRAASRAVDEASYRIEQFPEVQELEQRLGLVAAFGLKNPYFNVHERVTNDTSVIGGRTMINWSSYNYLGLSGDPP